VLDDARAPLALGEDWIFFASHEAGYLELGDAVATGSSLMPQKKNPDGLELVRGKSGRVFGALHGLLVTLKGLPLAYDKDLQEDKEALFGAVDSTRACLSMCALVVKNAHFRAERCRAEASRGYLDATDLADLLVKAGVPFRKAHERVGAACAARSSSASSSARCRPASRASSCPSSRESTSRASSPSMPCCRGATRSAARRRAA